MGDKPDYPYIITPAHFLILQPEIPSPITDTESLQKGFLVKNELMDYFWELWRTEYLRSLPMDTGRSGRKTATPPPLPLAVGSVVLLREEGSSCTLRPLDLVEQFYPSKDGHVRSIEVRTKKGICTRSIQRLLQLEAVTAPPSLSVDPVISKLPPITEVSRVPAKGTLPLCSHYGRLIKPVTRLCFKLVTSWVY